MQSLEIISVNLWHILISLCNLLLLYLIIKKFLYKPVKKMLEKRGNTLREMYESAENSRAEAQELKKQWEEKMDDAYSEADGIIKRAAETAEIRSKAIVDEGNAAAERITRKAESDAELIKKKAQAGIKKEIIEVSTALSEKMLGREINADDHRELIDNFLSEIGEEDDADE